MEPMSADAAAEMLQFSKFGSLALQEDGHTYNVPLFFAYDGDNVYFQCHPGDKDHYVESTKEACLTVVHAASDNVWESVMVFGPVEKLTLSDDLDAARAALMKIPFPPMEGNYPKGTPKRSDRQVYYLRLQPARITGVASTYHDPDDTTVSE